MELKTARLTVLIDPSTKDAFESACRQVDMTPSQVVRRLIREFMENRQAARKAAAKPAGKARSRAKE